MKKSKLLILTALFIAFFSCRKVNDIKPGVDDQVTQIFFIKGEFNNELIELNLARFYSDNSPRSIGDVQYSNKPIFNFFNYYIPLHPDSNYYKIKDFRFDLYPNILNKSYVLNKNYPLEESCFMCNNSIHNFYLKTKDESFFLHQYSQQDSIKYLEFKDTSILGNPYEILNITFPKLTFKNISDSSIMEVKNLQIRYPLKKGR